MRKTLPSHDAAIGEQLSTRELPPCKVGLALDEFLEAQRAVVMLAPSQPHEFTQEISSGGAWCDILLLSCTCF